MILSHSCGFCYFIFYFLNFIPYRLRIIVEYSFTVREEKLPPRVALRVPMRRREAGPAPCPARSPLTALTAPGGAPAAAGARRRGLAGARGRCRSSLPRRRLPGRAERRGRGAAWRRRRGLRRGPGGGGSAWGVRQAAALPSAAVEGFSAPRCPAQRGWQLPLCREEFKVGKMIRWSNNFCFRQCCWGLRYPI